MDYALVKLVHQGAVALSLGGFLVRGAASLAGAAWVRGRAARTLPHCVDTVLLASAVALAWAIGAHPAQAPWLLAKLAGLVVYVALGLVALRAGCPTRVRAIAWVAALLTAGWIVSVAVTKNPAGLFAGS